MFAGEIPAGESATALIGALFFVVALLYSSVGHAGASGYLAVMVFFGLPATVMRPVALSLNILVAGLTVYRFRKAGHLKARDIWPLVLLSVPMAFIGGSITLPADIYRPVLGALLIVSAVYLVWKSAVDPNRFESDRADLPRAGTLGLGGGIGLLSGLTGIGGGVLLSPALLLLRWTNVRRTSAIAAAFILCNSSAGLAGNVIATGTYHAVIPLWAAAAMAGGFVGARLGAQVLASRVLVWLLAAAVFVAGAKFVLT